jgi:hypothetical protein
MFAPGSRGPKGFHSFCHAEIAFDGPHCAVGRREDRLGDVGSPVVEKTSNAFRMKLLEVNQKPSMVA